MPPRHRETKPVETFRSRRVVIAGYYGFGNAGDEMILRSVLADVRSVIDGPRFTVISGDPSATAAAFNVEAFALPTCRQSSPPSATAIW